MSYIDDAQQQADAVFGSEGESQNFGAEILDEVCEFLGRYIVYPNKHTQIAHTLWIAHAWLMDRWDSTPRLAALSPEPGSGKSRLLEVTEPLVPRPVHAVNATPAYLFRKVSDEAGRPTILFDEIDTIFGPKAKDNEDIRGMLNAGHRRGAMAGRCVVRGKAVEVEELPAYCAVALAGLDDLPDTIRTRSIIIRMKRRSPNEPVQAWRARRDGDKARPIAEKLELWAASAPEKFAWPEMPAGIEDRDADVWEALLAVADLAGGDWPTKARVTAVTLVTDSKAGSLSLGVQLLTDIREVFGSDDRLSSDDLIHKLLTLPESPWADIRGKELDARGLSRRLSKYEIKPKLVRIGDRPLRGYERSDFNDAWARYLPPLQESPMSHIESVTSVTTVTPIPGAGQSITCECGSPRQIIGQNCTACQTFVEDIPW